MGVRSIRLDEGDEVISLASIEEGAQVLCVSALGYGKRSDASLYRVTGRGGKGIIAMNLTDKTGPLAALLMVQEGEDILLVTDGGTIIRTPVGDIRKMARSTQGVRLMNVGEGCVIVGAARVLREAGEEQEAPSGETPSDEVEDGSSQEENTDLANQPGEAQE
jgi:DNA gyrase subunit A